METYFHKFFSRYYETICLREYSTSTVSGCIQHSKLLTSSSEGLSENGKK